MSDSSTIYDEGSAGCSKYEEEDESGEMTSKMIMNMSLCMRSSMNSY